MARWVKESELRFRVDEILHLLPVVRGVTGPGRSGAIASVYLSHALGVPWIPYGIEPPINLRPFLVADTTEKTGKTLRKAAKRLRADYMLVLFPKEDKRLKFWYER